MTARMIVLNGGSSSGKTGTGRRALPRRAVGREIARVDRVPGMAASQADLVHAGVTYDLEVDTTHTESIECARTVARHLS